MSKTKIDERYRSAVHSRNLVSDPKTFRSDPDVLGAYALADKYLTRGMDGHGNSIKPSPLSVALERMLSGDNGAASNVVLILGEMAFKKSRAYNVRMGTVQAHDLAKVCIAWYREGTCKPCGGHGKLVIKGTVTLGIEDCPKCHGMGRIDFERQIDPDGKSPDLRELGRWMLSEMDRALGRAGPLAMAAIAPRLEL